MNKKSWLEKLRTWWDLPEDYREYQWTQTPVYKKRLKRVRDFWIVGGVMMLLSGHLAFILSSSLFLSFLSFAYLEE